MALVKSTELNNTGVVGEYFKNFHIDINVLHETIKVQAICYKDAAARDAGKAPTNFRETAEVSGEDFATWFNAPIPEGATTVGEVLLPMSYDFVKQNNENLADAVDA